MKVVLLFRPKLYFSALEKEIGNCTPSVSNGVRLNYNEVLKVFSSWYNNAQYFGCRIVSETFCASL